MMMILIAPHEGGMNEIYNDKSEHVMNWCCELSEEI